MAGFLEVGVDPKTHEVVINHPDLKPDADGVGHIVFSPREAMNLAYLLNKHAMTALGLSQMECPGFPVRRIEVDFAIPVKMTEAIRRFLREVVNRIARASETEDIVHWASGQGSKPIWNEPHEPTWDDSVYHIKTASRQRYPSEPFNPEKE